MQRFVLQTWNCFGAAQNAISLLRRRGVPDPHRFEHPEVVRIAHEADVVCMQEVFLSDAESFFDRLAHDHKHRDDNFSRWWPLTIGGSGLGLASRFPIVERRVLPFGRPQLGAERFARKGMLHARIRVRDGIDVDVVTTHLQAGYSPKAQSVRERQLRELRALVDEVGSPERPCVVAGDLNICGLRADRETGEYAAIARTLHDFVDLGADEDHPTFHPDPEVNSLAHRFEAASPRQRIDYVLFRPPATGHVRITAFEIVFREPIVDEVRGRTFASDHFGLRAVFGLDGSGPSQSE